jgi:hypothetical protein
MISEIGVSVSSPAESRQFVEKTIQSLQSLSNYKGLGVFWWEPQAYDWKGYDKVAWNYNTASKPYQATDAMKGFKYGCNGTAQPLTIAISSPVNAAVFTAPSTVTLGVNTSASVSKVEFYNGTSKIGEDLSSPFSFAWANLGVGTYNITAKASAANGSSVISAPVTFTVSDTKVDSLAVTFKVNVAGVNTANGIYITGAFTGSNWSIVPMTSLGNNIYSYTKKMIKNDSGAYYYLNANTWTARETVPVACVKWYGIDRGYKITTNNQIINDVWASCNVVTADYDNETNETVVVQPNHSSSDFQMVANSLVNVEVFTLDGSKVDSFVNSKNFSFGGNYKPGIYFVRVNMQNEIKTFKIIKQ